VGENAHLHDRAFLREHRAALRAFEAAASGVSQETLGALEAAIQETERTIERWARKRAEAQRRLDAATRAARACHADPRAGDCSAEDQARADAEDWLATTEENLATSRRCSERLRAAAGRFRQELSAYRRHLELELAAGAAFLGAAALAADTYVGSQIGGSGGATAGSASGMGDGAGWGSVPGGLGGEASTSPEPRVGDTELVEVRLDRIDTGDSQVSGPGSFRKTDYATMRDGVQRLDEVILPAVKGGAGHDYFAAMDAQRGLSHERGYLRVYEAFFGDDSLRLDANPGGGYTVTNGYHRIYVARELGLQTLPARVSRPPR
jgi:hypothetical protein